ncbi:hypothetical protein ACLOJK_008798 [Asimina triloba]
MNIHPLLFALLSTSFSTPSPSSSSPSSLKPKFQLPNASDGRRVNQGAMAHSIAEFGARRPAMLSPTSRTVSASTTPPPAPTSSPFAPGAGFELVRLFCIRSPG